MTKDGKSGYFGSDRMESNAAESTGQSRGEDPRAILFDYIRCSEFKRLLDQIHTLQETQDLKSLAVLSEFAGEGKTFLISVLALGYASFLRKRVLIMDTISQTRDESFYLTNVLGSQLMMDGQGEGTDKGIIDLITSRSLYRQIQLYEQHEPIPALEAELPVPYDERFGYENSDFQIGSFVASLYDSYDLILLDTCALKDVEKENLDPIILAKQAGAAILVTSQRSLERSTMGKIKKELQRSNVTLVGTIFNDGPNQ